MRTLVALSFVLWSAAALAEPSRSTAADTGPMLGGSKVLAASLGGVALLLGLALYLVPSRAAEATRKRVEQAMSERAVSLQEEDRRRIARELHDGAGQALTAARLQLAALRARAPEHKEALGRVIEHLDEAMAEVRRSTTALAPPALAELGLAGALERHCDAFAGASGLAVEVELDEPLPALDAHLETTCYRIAQEALSNAARHAGAKRAWIRLRKEARALELEVGDDGVGLGDASGGFGLDSIRQRARLAGGAVEILEGPGPGPRVRVLLPVEAAA